MTSGQLMQTEGDVGSWINSFLYNFCSALSDHLLLTPGSYYNALLDDASRQV